MVMCVRVVSLGVEDYYMGGFEVCGVWIGDGMWLFGFVGVVDVRWFDCVFGGEYFINGESFGWVVCGWVFGFDLMFLVFKSVSVLFGVVDDDLCCVVRDVYD